MPDVIGEYVDRLCTIEMRPSGGNLPRGMMHRLYDVARPEGQPPHTLAMAEALVVRVAPATPSSSSPAPAGRRSFRSVRSTGCSAPPRWRAS